MKLNELIQILTDSREKAQGMCKEVSITEKPECWHYWDGKFEGYTHALTLLETYWDR